MAEKYTINIEPIENVFAINITTGQKFTVNYGPDFSKYALKTELPSKLSELENDPGFITEEDLPTVPTKLSDLQDDENHRLVTDLQMQYIIKLIYAGL